MPAPQLHLTFGELVQHNPAVPAAMRRACAAEPIYTRLGAIFHDLPYYYAPMVFEAVRYGFGAPALDEPWGYRVHCVRPARLVASYIRAARTEPGLTRQEGLALVGGLLSHCALDLSLHPLVNYCARRDVLRYGGHESTHHRLTEKYHALFFHLERFGHDPLGTPQIAERARITKEGRATNSRVEPALVRFMTAAYTGAYGGAPSPERWSRWVRNFRQFGIMLSMPPAARNSMKTRTEAMRRRYYANEVFDFRAFYAAAERRLAELCQLSYAYFDAADFSREAEDAYCAAAGVDDLAEPAPVGLPDIPYLP
ncbi:MAG: hypothetical protein NZ890_20895, partial [Myxococcota bacterium]|nr:hypothetical protein [Myxococcota bacterium]